MADRAIKIENINLGGISDSDYQGPTNSQAKIVGLDIHSMPGLIRVNQALKKDSGTTVTEFCKVRIACSDGNTYWFSSDSGKIWKRTSAGVYSLVYTTVPTSGEAKCLGAREYNGYIYWATQNHLHRIALTGLSDWSTNNEANWQDFSLEQEEIGGTGEVYQLPSSITENDTGATTVSIQTTDNQSYAVGEADSTSNSRMVAQSFKATIDHIQYLFLDKNTNTGTFAGDLLFSLQEDVSGNPSGVDLVSSVMTNAQYLALANGEFSVYLPTPVTVNDTYWLVITPSTADSSNCINLGSNSSGGYSDGTLKYGNTTDGWVDSSDDLYLKVGYDRYYLDKCTFYAKENVQAGVSVNINTIGTGNWTVTIHDSADTAVASKTIANASLATGWNNFMFTTAWEAVIGDEYHIHITSSVSSDTAKVEAIIAQSLGDGNIRILTSADSGNHFMITQNLVLYIGDRNYIHQVDQSTLTGEHIYSPFALDISKPYKITCLGKYGTDILIGTYINDNVNDTDLLTWNTWSRSYSVSDNIKEVGINAFIDGDNFVLVNAGTNGNLYMYESGKLILYKTIPGDYKGTNACKVNPYATANYKGLPIFGVSNVSGNPCVQGIYSFGAKRAGFPLVLTMEYPISQRDEGALVVNNIEIGGLIVVGNDILASWKDNNDPEAIAYGIDVIDHSNKLSGAYLETRIINIDRYILNKFRKYVACFRSLPASTNLSVSYQKNHSSTWTALTGTKDIIRNMIYAELELEATSFRLRLDFTSSVNTAPELEYLYILFE